MSTTPISASALRGAAALLAAVLLAACGDGKQPSGAAREPGALEFTSYCAACHQPDGRGVDGGAPPLEGSTWVTGDERRLICIVLHGLGGQIEVKGRVYQLEMPSFGPILGDHRIAAVLSYVRRRHGGAPVSAESVRRVREATRERHAYWTVEELLDATREGR